MVVELHPEDLQEKSMTAFMKDYVRSLDAPECTDLTDLWHYCDPESVWNGAPEEHPLALLYFQEAIERQNWVQGQYRQTAPAQRMADFVNKRLSYDLPRSSYSPGLISSPLHFWMPQFIAGRLARGFQNFGKSSHGFLTNDAVMIAVESRTSAPVRILRRPDTLQHVTVAGLFPCGEGAGYAGGIVSAGIDGERCAEAAAAYLNGIGCL